MLFKIHDLHTQPAESLCGDAAPESAGFAESAGFVESAGFIDSDEPRAD